MRHNEGVIRSNITSCRNGTCCCILFSYNLHFHNLQPLLPGSHASPMKTTAKKSDKAKTRILFSIFFPSIFNNSLVFKFTRSIQATKSLLASVINFS